MFFHKKETIHVVNVDEANPKFAQLLLEQFGGATGELTAALQYWVQSFHVENAGIRDMLQDIAIEEFGHLEMVGKMIEAHTKNVDQTDAYKSTLFAMRGMGPHFLNSQGSAWTANYINEGGDVVRDETVDIYYNLSSNGKDERGPWNSEPTFRYVADPVNQSQS